MTANADEIDNAIYRQIEKLLIPKYGADVAVCIAGKLEAGKVADSFYSSDLFFDDELLLKKVDPFLKKAEVGCVKDADKNKGETDSDQGSDKNFFSTNWGIATIVAIVAIVLAVGGFGAKTIVARKQGQRVPTSDRA